MHAQRANSSGESRAKLVLQWVGDISFNGRLCSPQYHEALAQDIAKLVEDAGQCDLRIGNFEAPLWGDGGVNELKVPRLCTTVEAAKCVLPLGLDVVLLGNNHVYDCLEKGFENTIRFLRENKIQCLGAGTSPAEAAKPLILIKKGLRLALLDYVRSDTHFNIPAGAGVFLNVFDEERVLSEIVDLSKEVDVILLHLHWGQVELVRFPSVSQRSFARKAIEAGATVVACGHAHCLQGHEDWKEGHVFYGLGNFVFDEVDGQTWPELARRTALASVEVSQNCVERAWLMHLYQKDLRLECDNRRSRKRVQNRLNYYLKLPERLYRLVYGWELLYQKIIVSYFRFVQKSGGFILSLFSIRKRHVLAVMDILFKFGRR